MSSLKGAVNAEKKPIERKPEKSKEIKPKVTFSKQNTSTPKNKVILVKKKWKYKPNN